jgi:hypothetical protein
MYSIKLKFDGTWQEIDSVDNLVDALNIASSHCYMHAEEELALHHPQGMRLA